MTDFTDAERRVLSILIVCRGELRTEELIDLWFDLYHDPNQVNLINVVYRLSEEGLLTIPGDWENRNVATTSVSLDVNRNT